MKLCDIICADPVFWDTVYIIIGAYTSQIGLKNCWWDLELVKVSVLYLVFKLVIIRYTHNTKVTAIKRAYSFTCYTVLKFNVMSNMRDVIITFMLPLLEENKF